MISRLYQPDPPFSETEGCASCPEPTSQKFFKDGKIYTIRFREKVQIEHPYTVMVRATAFAIKTSRPYTGRTPRRDFRDYLVKTNLVI